MHRLVWLTAALSMAACTCGKSVTTRRIGELVVVLPDGTNTREATLEGLRVPMGQRGVQPVVVRNIGRGPATLTRVSLDDELGPFSVRLPDEPLIASQADLSLELAFTPPQNGDATIFEVPHRVKLTIEAEGVEETEGPLVVEVLAYAVAGDCLVPKELDFGEVPVGLSVRANLPLKNQGTETQRSELEAPTGPDAPFFVIDGPATFEVDAGAVGTLPLRFTPLGERPYLASVALRRAPLCPQGTITLKGVGSSDALSWSPQRLDFGPVPLNDTAARQVVVRSKSNVPLIVSGARLSSSAFVLVGPTPSEIPARGGVALSIGCRPEALGALSGTFELLLESTPPRVISIPLTCTGGGPRLKPTPSGAMPFGVVPYRASNPQVSTRRLVVQNIGNPPPSEPLFLGREGGQLPLFSIVGVTGPETDWRVSVPSTYDAAKGLPGVVGQNAIELTVTLTPSAAGRREADLFLYSNDSVEPAQRVRLSAEARNTQGCSLTPTAEALAVGDVPPGAVVTQTLSLLNIGTSACIVTSAEVTPAGPFSLVSTANVGVSIAPNTQASFQVRLQVPANATAGDAYSGTLLLATSDPNRAMLSVPLSARASNCIEVTPNRVDFGTTRPLCKSPVRSVFLYNVCTVPVQLRTITRPAAPFSIVQQPALGPSGVMIASGALPLSVQLQFLPSQQGSFTGTLDLGIEVSGANRLVSVPLTGQATGDGITEDAFTQLARPQADILFTIDNSCSMADEQASLAQNLNSFLSYARQRNVEFNIGVTTTDDTTATAQGRLVGTPTVLTHSDPQLTQRFAAKVMVGINGAGIERPLATSIKAVTRPLIDRDNQGFIRTEATLSVIIVTDALDQSPEPISYYVNRFLTAKGTNRSWLVSVNVVGPFVGRPGCILDSGYLDDGRLRAAVNATSGVAADICTDNWSRELEAVARSSFGAKTVFPLTSPPDTSQPVTVSVNGVLQTSGYQLDPVTNAVEFTGQPPGAGSTVRVSYRPMCF